MTSIRSYSEKQEISLLVKLVQENEETLNEILEREKVKQSYFLSSDKTTYIASSMYNY